MDLQGGPYWTYRVAHIGPTEVAHVGPTEVAYDTNRDLKRIYDVLPISKLFFDKFALIALGKKISDQRFKPKIVLANIFTQRKYVKIMFCDEFWISPVIHVLYVFFFSPYKTNFIHFSYLKIFISCL